MLLPLPKISDMYSLIYCFNCNVSHVIRISAHDFIISCAHSVHINKFENHTLYAVQMMITMDIIIVPYAKDSILRITHIK